MVNYCKNASIIRLLSIGNSADGSMVSAVLYNPYFI
jgi:hypothetical protein